MDNLDVLKEYEDNWTTDIGACFASQRVVYRGKDLLNDLSGSLSWMGLLLYGITGRSMTESQIRIFEGMWKIGTSYPDPRIWNNRVAALAGTVRSTAALALGAATAVSEAIIYGNRVNKRAIDFFYRLDQHIEKGGKLKGFLLNELKEYRAIPGYGRPLTPTDERVEPLKKLATHEKVSEGKHFKRAFEIEDYLQNSRYRMHINATAIGAALAADQGLTSEEYHQYMTLCFSAGMFPCYLDAKRNPEGAFFPLRCDRIKYDGPARRFWSKEK